MRSVSPLGDATARLRRGRALAAHAHAADQPPAVTNQLTIDVGAASIGVTHAWRLGTAPRAVRRRRRHRPFPLLGKTFATGTHFDDPGHVDLLEIVHAQLFMRFELASWLRVDTGVRAGAFLHGGSSSVSGGPFAALFVAPALAWRWLWVGPRVSGSVLAEDGDTRRGADHRIRHAALRVQLVAPARRAHELAQNTRGPAR